MAIVLVKEKIRQEATSAEKDKTSGLFTAGGKAPYGRFGTRRGWGHPRYKRVVGQLAAPGYSSPPNRPYCFNRIIQMFPVVSAYSYTIWSPRGDQEG